MNVSCLLLFKNAFVYHTFGVIGFYCSSKEKKKSIVRFIGVIRLQVILLISGNYFVNVPLALSKLTCTLFRFLLLISQFLFKTGDKY